MKRWDLDVFGGLPVEQLYQTFLSKTSPAFLLWLRAIIGGGTDDRQQ